MCIDTNNMRTSNLSAYFLLAAFGLCVVACSQQPEQTVEQEPAKTEVERTEVVSTGAESKAIASLGIEGMTCAIGCAGKIQKTLAAMDGIIACDVLFEDKIAEVRYDDTKISEDDMVAAIQELNKGQFKVTLIEIEKTVVKDVDSDIDAEENPDDKETAMNGTISFPNIFDVFTRLYSY